MRIDHTKILGIDYGDAYIGLAVAESGSFAVPYRIVEHSGSVMQELEKIITDESITKIVVGFPLSLSGQENERTRKTREFIDALKKRTDVPIVITDERLTSVAASAKGVTGRVDAAAAADILQGYLDRKDHVHDSV